MAVSRASRSGAGVLTYSRRGIDTESRNSSSRPEMSMSGPIQPYRCQVQADEDVGLGQIRSIQLLRRVRSSPELEHHRCELEPGDGASHRGALLRHLGQRRAHEDTQSLVGRPDRGRHGEECTSDRRAGPVFPASSSVPCRDKAALMRFSSFWAWRVRRFQSCHGAEQTARPRRRWRRHRLPRSAETSRSRCKSRYPSAPTSAMAPRNSMNCVESLGMRPASRFRPDCRKSSLASRASFSLPHRREALSGAQAPGDCLAGKSRAWTGQCFLARFAGGPHARHQAIRSHAGSYATWHPRRHALINSSGCHDGQRTMRDRVRQVRPSMRRSPAGSPLAWPVCPRAGST